jgi:hypothetical protein
VEFVRALAGGRMTSPATKLRLELAAIGITPLPSTITKEVFLPEWTTRVIDEAEILSWDGRRDWPNTSARLGTLSCLDLDIRDEESVDAAELLVRTRFDGRGMMLLRTGRAPKRLIPFCVDTPFAKRVLCYRAPNGDPHRIEFLCDGQQAVFYGMHESGKPYTWHADTDPTKAPPSEWVTITEAEVDVLLAELDEMLVEQFNYTRIAPPGPNGPAKSSAHVTDVTAALATLHYAGHGGGGNIHDISLGCINALIVQDTAADNAVEEVLAAVCAYAATNPLCARWSRDKGRLILEKDGLQLHQQVSGLCGSATPRSLRNAPGPPRPGRPRPAARLRPDAPMLALSRAPARHRQWECGGERQVGFRNRQGPAISARAVRPPAPGRRPRIPRR